MDDIEKLYCWSRCRLSLSIHFFFSMASSCKSFRRKEFWIIPWGTMKCLTVETSYRSTHCNCFCWSLEQTFCLFSNMLLNRNYLKLSKLFYEWQLQKHETRSLCYLLCFSHDFRLAAWQSHGLRLEHRGCIKCTHCLIISIHVSFLLYICFKHPDIQSHNLRLLMHHRVFGYY